VCARRRNATGYMILMCEVRCVITDTTHAYHAYEIQVLITLKMLQ